MKKDYLEYQKDIGERLKQYRIRIGMTQSELERKCGVSVRSISRLEQGASVQLESLIKILSALNLDENINLLIPDQTKRPSYFLEKNEKKRQRAGRKSTVKSGFKWGDEEE